MGQSPSFSGFRRFIGLHLLIGIMMFSPLLDGGTTHVATMILRVLILSIAGAYLIDGMKAKAVIIPSIAVGPPVLLFLGLAVVSTAVSPYSNQSLQWLFVCVSYAGLLYLATALVDHWGELVRGRTVLLCMAAGEAILAVVQHILGHVERPTGTFFNPNFLASYLAVALVLLLAMLCYRKIPRRGACQRSLNQSWLAAVLWLSVVAILLVGVFQTGSRGGAMALVAGAALVIMLRFGRRGLIALGLCVVIAVIVPNPIRDRAVAEHEYNPVAYARWEMWRGALHEMIEHPFGIGLGLYQYTSPLYAFPMEDEIVRYGKIAQRPHNEYLQIGVEMGIVGFLIVAWGLARVARDAQWVLRRRLSREQRAMIVGACGAITIILTQALVDSNFHEPALAILLTLLVSVVMVGRKLSRGSMSPPRIISIQRPMAWALVSVGVISFLAIHAIRLGLAYQSYESGNRLAKHDLQQAIESFQRAISLDPGKSLYHNSLAGVYFQEYRQSHNPAALNDVLLELETGIALNPLDGRLQALLGFVASSQISTRRSPEWTAEDRRWLKRAVEAYQRAATLEPFSYAHRFELARLMLWIGQQDEAKRYFDSVVELEPNFLPAREALVRLEVESGRMDMADKEYREIVARQKQLSPRVTNQLERSFLQADRPGLEAMLAGKVSRS